VKTVTERQAHVHVSGHPARPELAAMYHWIRPEILIPFMAKAGHLHEHRRFALDQGIPRAWSRKMATWCASPRRPAKIGEQRVGRLVLDGDVILPADGTTMNARRRMAVNGVIAVAVPLNDSGRLAGDVAVMLEGIPVEEDRDAFLARAAAAAQEAVRGAGADEAKLTEAVRLAVRRSATEYTGKKPIVRVMILRV
jgi:ribonuclease J